MCVEAARSFVRIVVETGFYFVSPFQLKRRMPNGTRAKSTTSSSDNFRDTAVFNFSSVSHVPFLRRTAERAFSIAITSRHSQHFYDTSLRARARRFNEGRRHDRAEHPRPQCADAVTLSGLQIPSPGEVSGGRAVRSHLPRISHASSLSTFTFHLPSV